MKAFRLLVFAPLLALCGCGLYQIQTLLHSPGGYPTAATGTPIFTINYTSDIGNPVTGQGFLGFELFYKLDASSSPIPPSLSDTTTPDDLVKLGFLPVCSSRDTSSTVAVSHTRPLIAVSPLDINTNFDITIDFNSFTGSYTPPFSSEPLVTYKGANPPPVPVSVRRDVPDPTLGSPTYSQAKPFVKLNSSYAAFLPADSDATTLFNPPLPTQISIMVCALSYGQSGGYDEWSAPVYLGVIGLSFPQ